LFDQVRRRMLKRKSANGGPKGKDFKNLFYGLAVTCAYCRGKYHFQKKEAKSSYLFCRHAYRKTRCTGLRLRYDRLEKAFVDYLSHVDINAIVSEAKDDNASVALGAKIEILEGEIEATETTIRNVMRHQDTGSDRMKELARKELADLDRKLAE